MKIERINENQIKCTLNRSDLASRQIKISELAYGSEKTKILLQDMMEQALNEVGFEASDIPLMIEAIPVSMDCIVLMITKVEDPDEIDPEFSDISHFGNTLPAGIDSQASSYFLDDRTFKDLLNEIDASADVNISSAVSGSHKQSPGILSMQNIFSFDSIMDVIELSHCLKGRYNGKNSLYKCNKNGKYYLVMEKSGHTVREYGFLLNSVMEYGHKESLGYAGDAYIDEHFTHVIDGDAVQSLAYV